MKTYTDAGKLPTRAAIEGLPSLLPEGSPDKWTPQWTPDLVKNGQAESQAVTKNENSKEPGRLIDRGSGHDQSHCVTSGQREEKWCAVQGSNL